MGCAVLPPKTFREAFVRILCGVVFSFTLTPLAGPLLGGIVEKNVGPRAAEGLYDAPAGVGILVGMLSYFVATFAMSVARHTTRDAVKNETTLHDIRTRNRIPDPVQPPPLPLSEPIKPSDSNWTFSEPNCPPENETNSNTTNLHELPPFSDR